MFVSSRRVSPPAHSDINVTPLIDVLLVLLIIFMATLPLTQQGLDAALPQSAAAPPAQAPPPNHVVAEYFNGQLTINKQPVDLPSAAARFREIFSTRRDRTLYVIASRLAKYREIIAIIDAAKAGGAERFGIVTDELRKQAGGSY